MQHIVPNDQLIPIIEHDGETAVNLRDLHEFLEVTTRFSDWAPRMFEYGFTEGQDYVEISLLKNEERVHGGQNRKDYAVTLDMAKEVSMIQRTDKGKQARQYFIEAEKRLNQPLDEIEVAERYVAELKRNRELTPKAEAWDTLAGARGDYSVEEAAKMLSRDDQISIGRNRLFTVMGGLGWIYRWGKRQSWHAYQDQVDNGRLVLRMSSAFQNQKTGEMEVPAPTIRITAKGVEALRTQLLGQVAA